MQKYHELKAAIRDGVKKTKTENKEAQTPDLDKLKGELRKEIEQEVQKIFLPPYPSQFRKSENWV